MYISALVLPYLSLSFNQILVLRSYCLRSSFILSTFFVHIIHVLLSYLRSLFIFTLSSLSPSTLSSLSSTSLTSPIIVLIVGVRGSGANASLISHQTYYWHLILTPFAAGSPPLPVSNRPSLGERGKWRRSQAPKSTQNPNTESLIQIEKKNFFAQCELAKLLKFLPSSSNCSLFVPMFSKLFLNCPQSSSPSLSNTHCVNRIPHNFAPLS